MTGVKVPDIAALELLLAVERTGSLSAAAAELGVTQQAVSQRVRSMETLIGFALLNRTARGSTLTEAGRMTAQWAAKILDAAAEMEAGLAALRADAAAQLRVVASLTVAEHLLPGWLVALRQRQRSRGMPVTNVRLTATNTEAAMNAVLNDEADIGFVEGPAVPSRVRSRVVATDRLTIVVAPEHPWIRRRRPLTAGDLAATSLVSREHGSGTRQALVEALRSTLGPETVLAPSALELSSTAAVRAAVAAGAGPAALSSLAVADDIALGRLRTVEVEGLGMERQLRAVWAGPPEPPAGPARELVALARHLSLNASRRPG